MDNCTFYVYQYCISFRLYIPSPSTQLLVSNFARRLLLCLYRLLQIWLWAEFPLKPGTVHGQYLESRTSSKDRPDHAESFTKFDKHSVLVNHFLKASLETAAVCRAVRSCHVGNHSEDLALGDIAMLGQSPIIASAQALDITVDILVKRLADAPLLQVFYDISRDMSCVLVTLVWMIVPRRQGNVTETEHWDECNQQACAMDIRLVILFSNQDWIFLVQESL